VFDPERERRDAAAARAFDVIVRDDQFFDCRARLGEEVPPALAVRVGLNRFDDTTDGERRGRV